MSEDRREEYRRREKGGKAVIKIDESTVKEKKINLQKNKKTHYNEWRPSRIKERSKKRFPRCKFGVDVIFACIRHEALVFM